MSDPIIQVLKRLVEKYPPGKNVEFKHQYVRFNEKEQPASKDRIGGKMIYLKTKYKTLPQSCWRCAEHVYSSELRKVFCPHIRIADVYTTTDTDKRPKNCPLVEIVRKSE